MAAFRVASAMGLEQLEAALKAGPAGPAYALDGPEVFLRCAAIRLIRASVLGDEKGGAGLAEFDAEATPDEVFGHLRTRALFSDARMAVIEPADPFVARYAAALARYLDAPSAGACLVLAVERLELKDQLAKAFKNALVVSCDRLRGKAVNAWLRQRARGYGKRLDAGVEDMMIEAVGADLAGLDRHLQNLLTFVGERENVSVQDVEALVAGDPRRASWELLRAILQRKTADALRILDQMLRHGAEPAMVIGALAAEFSRLWQVKRLLRDRAPDGRICEVIEPRIKSMPPSRRREAEERLKFRLPHVKREAEEVSPKRLLAAHPALVEYDLADKTSSMPEDLLLECLVVKLCQT
jgi:DNA polymerase-3 subunit delta